MGGEKLSNMIAERRGTCFIKPSEEIAAHVHGEVDFKIDGLPPEMAEAFAMVAAERFRHLTPELAWQELDKVNTRNDWVAYITTYAGRASGVTRRNGEIPFREMMTKVAALALAAVEADIRGYVK